MSSTLNESLAADESRRLRYKRPALQMLSYEDITNELYEISSRCEEMQWTVNDDDALLDALGGNEEEAFEFKMAFSDLSATANQLNTELDDRWNGVSAEDFDDVMVGMIGNKYNLIGFDNFEMDYFRLLGYDRNLALSEAGKRVMRHTKSDMLSLIGQCLGITLAFQDLRYKYDYLQASFDILNEQDHALLNTIKEIETLYEEAEQHWGEWSPELSKRLDRLTQALPDRVWVE
jgi:hypothetical protein